MTDRSRQSRLQPQRTAASKTRELEADAIQKEAQLQELRQKMSQERQEIDKLISKRGPQLWSSSKEIRASATVRQSAHMRSSPAKAKGGLLTETSSSPAAKTQQPASEASTTKAKPAQQSPLHSHTSISSLQRASSNTLKQATKPTAMQPKSSLNSPTSLLRSSSSNSNAAKSPASPFRLQPTAGLKTTSSLQRTSSSNSSPRNPYLQGGPQRAASLQHKGSSSGCALKLPTDGSKVAAAGSVVSNVSVNSDISNDGLLNRSSMYQELGSKAQHLSSTGRKATVEAIASAPSPPVDQKVRAAAFPGPSLLDGHFSEDDSSASFADALKAWRGNVKTPPPEEASAPGMSSQAGSAGLAQGLSAAQPKTYFERLFWSQASREAASAVTQAASRSEETAVKIDSLQQA